MAGSVPARTEKESNRGFNSNSFFSLSVSSSRRLLVVVVFFSSLTKKNSKTKKKINSRPLKSSCVCHALPPEKLDSKATLVVLQHPFEIRRRLATVPLLSAALRKASVPRGRRFGGELCPAELKEALERAERERIPVLLMFPGPDALDVKEVAEKGIPMSVFEKKKDEGGDGGGGGGDEGCVKGDDDDDNDNKKEEKVDDNREQTPPPLAFPPVRGREYILVAVDGTWKQGVQMFRVS